MKISAKFINVLFGAMLIFFSTGRVFSQSKLEKAEFYNVMASGDLKTVDNEITIIQNSSSDNKTGYEGALLMKKAGMNGKPAQKLKLFKEGRIKLETALMADKGNTEYHFLRLAIEEHAPKIVKYHADIESDRQIVKSNFKGLSPVVQHAIVDYCKSSKILHAEDFSSR